MLLLILFFLITISIVFYFYIKYKHGYWKRLNITYVEPRFLFGNVNKLRPVKNFCFVLQDHYEKYKGKTPFVGLIFFINPVAMVIDLEMIKNILVKDFNYFVNRGIFYNEKDDPLSAHLFSIENQKWRDLRNKLSPTFTSGKMKLMFPIITGIAEEFKKCIINEIKINEEFEIKEMLARFTTDVIGSCAFGIDCNSLKDPNTKFREMGKLIFTKPRYPRMIQSLMGGFPNIARKLRLSLNHPIVSDFFINVVESTMNYRKTNKIQRNDFMNLLMQLEKSDVNENGLTLGEISAQAFVFFLAGFETSSTAMSYSLYELSLNQEIQEKARKEVMQVLKKHNGEFTYEAMMEMKYLEQVINESLRKYPPVPLLLRKTTMDYNEPLTGIVLKKNVSIIIPVNAIHHDENLYPNPSLFDPNRFSDEEVRKRNPYSFIPFGDGPRNCIGLRFGMMQAKVGMAVLLSKFKFSLGAKTVVPIEFDLRSFILQSKGGLWLKVEQI